MGTDLVAQSVDGKWPCPNCDSVLTTLPRLRAHVSKHHRGVAIRTKVSRQPELRRLYVRRHRDKIKLARITQRMSEDGILDTKAHSNEDLEAAQILWLSMRNDSSWAKLNNAARNLIEIEKDNSIIKENSIHDGTNTLSAETKVESIGQ